jgi:peptidoglycan LD-endopeptidase CwlK
MPSNTTGANWRKIKRHHVEPALANLIDAAAERLKHSRPDLGVIITEGARDHKRQAELYRAGASRTLHSRHIPELTGTGRSHAVDVAITLNGQVRWDWPLYEQFAQVVKAQAACDCVKIVWGGDWPRLRDGPHYELKA